MVQEILCKLPSEEGEVDSSTQQQHLQTTTLPIWQNMHKDTVNGTHVSLATKFCLELKHIPQEGTHTEI